MQIMGYKVCKDKSLMRYFDRYSYDPGKLLWDYETFTIYDYGPRLKDAYWKIFLYPMNKFKIEASS